MSLGPHANNDAGGGRDLVFVSYSHEDAAWVQRVQVLMKPLLRSRRMRLWVDTDIRTGEEWHPGILRAIERSQVALVLVSADLLASDYVMDQELPALLRQGVRLASVLVGDCLWKYVPDLAKVHWLHDPGRDDALNLIADRPGQRDRRLREICEGLLQLVPAAAFKVSSSGLAFGAVAVAEVRVGDTLGELNGVPGLPPGYVERDELRGVIDAVAAVDTGAIGVTGRVTTVGLHGQGGIGKSVLATAVAHNKGIRGRFPDGVYWISVGEQADVLAAQLDLLARLGAPDQPVRSIAEALNRLCEVLADRQVLLVVDDVWSDAAAQAFRVTGLRGRVLYTSRAPQVLAAVGARLYPVDVLAPAAARAVAAGVLDVGVDQLPPEVDPTVASVGRVALAVALLAAAVRGGRSWSQVATDLARDADVFGDHPYANTFKAIEIAVSALPRELIEAWLTLAVFPPDTLIPVATIGRLWGHTRGQTTAGTSADLEVLAGTNLLRLEGGVVAFHDLQHDYLLLHAPAVAVLHASLLDAYRALLPDASRDQWWRLPVEEPYIWDHLVEHLRGAGERSILAAMVTNPAYLTQRIATHGLHAAEADLAGASTTLPAHQSISWWRNWLPRYANLLTSPATLTNAAPGRVAALAPTMRAWLSVDPSRPESVDPDRVVPLLSTPYLAVRWGLTPPATAQIRVLTGHTGPVHAVAWSPDGTRLATAGDDGEVRLWDPVSGRTTAVLTGHIGGVRAVVWSSDGSRLATASADREVRLWDPVSGRTTATLTGHALGVRAVVWSPDSTCLATAGDDGQVRLWDPVTGQTTATLTARTVGVAAVAWSPDGTCLATAGHDGQVRLWDPVTGSTIATLTGRTGGVYTVMWSPAGTCLATVSADREVRLWDPVSGRATATLTGHALGVRAVVWSPDGTRLATASGDGQVRLWDPVTGCATATLTGRTGGVRAVAWSSDGSRLATAGHDKQVRLWDPVTGRTTVTLTGRTDWVRAVAWSSDGSRLSTAGDDGQVRLWDPVTGRTTAILTGHTGGVRTVGWSPDGSRLATGGYDGQVRLWDPVTGHATAKLTGHTDWVSAVAWSPDGTCLATAGDDGKVLLWDPVTGRITATLAGHTGWVVAVAWCPDGTCLATAGDDGEVLLWDPVTGHTTTLYGHTGGVAAVAWSPDGTHLATASNDGQVRLWSPLTGHTATTLAGHTDWVRALAWSPDGIRLASASDDGEILVHDLQHQNSPARLRLESATCIAWTEGGIAVGGSNTVTVLELVFA